MVAAHEQLRPPAVFVYRNPCRNPVGKHGTGCSIRAYPGAKHQYAVRIRRQIVHGHDGGAHSDKHSSVYPGRHKDNQA